MYLLYMLIFSFLLVLSINDAVQKLLVMKLQYNYGCTGNYTRNVRGHR